MAWGAGLLVPVLTALVLVWRLAGPRDRIAMAIPAAGVAIGLASIIAFALLLAGVGARLLFIALDAAAWIGLAAVAFSVRRRAGSNAADPRSERRWIAAAALALLAATALVATVSFVASSGVFPHGEWDAWAQWNLRARFLFRGAGDGTWRDAFAPVLAWSHPDYPLLVPASVARLWQYHGRETVLAPIVFGGVMAAAAAAAAGLAAGRTRGTARGCLAAAIILACPSFVRYSAAQCADIALGFYVLAAFVFWANAGTGAAPRSRVCLALAGMAAALAGWTKNEGLAAFAILALIMAIERVRSSGWRGLGDLAPVLAGAAPVLLAVVIFKIALAPPSYFTAEQSLGQAAERLMDVERMRLVGAALAREMWLTGGTIVGVLPFLAVFAAVRGVDPAAPAAARAAGPAMLLLLGVYVVAYVVTPKDLAWQLRTSLDRLTLHVVPTLAWAIVAACR
jgi:hypothetical protein